MVTEKRTFWELLFGEGHGSEAVGQSSPEDVHRLGEGARCRTSRGVRPA